MTAAALPRSSPDIALSRIAGVVIAGGRSARFGSEKAIATFRGEPLVERAAKLFANLPAFAVSAQAGSGAERHARRLGVPVLHDAPDLPSGPLTGLLAALEWARQEGCEFLATAPCDAPLLPRNMVPVLARHVGDAAAAYAVTADGEHPLCALWSIALAKTIGERLHDGAHPAVRCFLAELGAVRVRFPDPQQFANANTPQALAALERDA